MRSMDGVRYGTPSQALIDIDRFGVRTWQLNRHGTNVVYKVDHKSLESILPHFFKVYCL